MTNQDVYDSWEMFLNPESLKANLIACSLYITAFEFLKESIIDHIKYFFANEFDKDGPRISDKYQSEVLDRNKSTIHASLSWLRENDVIDDEDLCIFKNIKDLRNKIAHEMIVFLDGEEKTDFTELFSNMISLLHKIEKWWIINVEIPTNPDFDDIDIDEEKITPSPVIILKIMLEISLGSEGESFKYYEEFKNIIRNNSKRND